MKHKRGAVLSSILSSILILLVLSLCVEALDVSHPLSEVTPIDVKLDMYNKEVVNVSSMGIGTTDPASELDIQQGKLIVNGSTKAQAAGSAAIYALGDGSSMSAVKGQSSVGTTNYGVLGGNGYGVRGDGWDYGVKGYSVNGYGGYFTSGGIAALYSQGTPAAIFNGTVGVGDVVPDTQLHVFNDDATDALKITDGTNEYNLSLGHADTVAEIQAEGSTRLDFDVGSASNVLTLGNDGDVGIGLASPATRLEVYDNTNGEDVYVRARYAGSGIDNAGFWSRAAVGSGIFQIVNSGADPRVEIRADNRTTYHPDIRFFTDESEAMRIENDGNVGIGTTSPNSLLSVGGTGDSNYAIYGSGTYGVYGSGTTAGVYGEDGSSYGRVGYGSYGLYGYGTSYGVYGYGSTYGGYFSNSGGTAVRSYGTTEIENGGLCIDDGTGCSSSTASDGDAVLMDGGLCIGDGTTTDCSDAEPLTDGTLYYVTADSAPWDIAEMYPSYDSLEKGEVVSIDPEYDVVVARSSQPYDDKVVGIVSTEPALRMGGWGHNYTPEAYPIALTGRVPLLVTDENGPIRRGDFLTTSSKAGYAMKWSLLDVSEAKDFEDLKRILAENEKRRSAILGKALEPLESGEGKIMAFVNVQ